MAIAPPRARQLEPEGGAVALFRLDGAFRDFEAEVTAVCDAKAVELVRSLGAPVVIDRFREDFTKQQSRGPVR